MPGDYVLKCRFCHEEMEYDDMKTDIYGGIYYKWKCNKCNITEIKPNGFQFEENKNMTQKSISLTLGQDQLIISATYNGVVDKWGLTRNHFIINVKNKSNDQEINFDFYDSEKNYEDGIEELDKMSLFSAFQCGMGDALIPDEYELSEFLEEYGYLESGEKALEGIKSYESCQVMLENVNIMLIETLSDWINYISDIENNDTYADHIIEM